MAGQHWLVLLAMFLVPPVAAWLCGVAHGRGCGGNTPWSYCYSVLVYLTCVPGTFAAVITAYTLFFTRENLLDVNPLVYFLPIASMVATLVLIHKNVTFDLVPGFDRLEGLMVMIACSFAFALAIQKTKIWIVFGGSIGGLVHSSGGHFCATQVGRLYAVPPRRGTEAGTTVLSQRVNQHLSASGCLQASVGPRAGTARGPDAPPARLCRPARPNFCVFLNHDMH